MERYGDALTLYLDGYLHDVHEAEDLMIEAFAQVFAKERPIRGDGHFKAYLYKTGRNFALHHLHKHWIPFAHFDELDFEPLGDERAETELIHSERRRQLHAALGELRAEYREALYLVYFEDMSYREAAAVMGRSEQQVAKLVYRGKQGLRTELEREGFAYANG